MSVAGYSVVGSLMLFNGTLNNCGVPVYTLAWKHTDDSSEPWSSRFVVFKNGTGAQKQQAVRGAIAALKIALPTVSWSLNGSLNGAIGLVAAIGHADAQLAVGSALEHVGQSIAVAMGWQWLPTVMTKQPHASLHSLGSNAAARSATVSGVYSVASATAFASLGAIVILDDFTTRGETINDIARALRAGGFTGHIWGLALGKTERSVYATSRNADIRNNHVPAALATAWDNA